MPKARISNSSLGTQRKTLLKSPELWVPPSDWLHAAPELTEECYMGIVTGSILCRGTLILHVNHPSKPCSHPNGICLKRAGSKLLAVSVLFSMWNLSHFEVNPQTALNRSRLRSHPIQGNRSFSLSLASYMPKQLSVSAAKISWVFVTENWHAGSSSLKRYLPVCTLFRLLAASHWLNWLKSCTKRIIFKK